MITHPRGSVRPVPPRSTRKERPRLEYSGGQPFAIDTAFNAYLYFRVGYWLAKSTARFLFRVRLGFTDRPTLAAIKPKSTVVFVMNHRSNLDYVLVAFLAAERVALSYAVGEWARTWWSAPAHDRSAAADGFVRIALG